MAFAGEAGGTGIARQGRGTPPWPDARDCQSLAIGTLGFGLGILTHDLVVWHLWGPLPMDRIHGWMVGLVLMAVGTGLEALAWRLGGARPMGSPPGG